MKFLFIPGVNNTQAAWEPVRDSLEQAGFASAAVTCPAIEDIDALARAVVPAGDEPFIVVGHSFGGMVALSIMEQMPERVKGLVLVNSSVGNDTPELALSRQAKADQALNGGYQELANGASARAYHPENAGREELMEARQKEIEDYGAERFAAHQKAMAGRPNRGQALLAFTGPKLIVAADQDVVIPTARQKQMAEAASAEYVEIAIAGHMLPAEAPQALVETLINWTKRYF